MPKTREQCKEIRDERKESIIKQCTYLFDFESYKSVSIDTITKVSKCSHGLFYHYFKNKEDVYKATLDYAIDTIGAENQKVNLYDQKAKYALHDLLDNLLSLLKSKNVYPSCQLYLLLVLYLEKSQLPKLPPKEFKDSHKPLYLIIKGLIEKGQSEGDFIDEDSRVLTVAILCELRGLSYSRILLKHTEFVCPSAKLLMNMVSVK